MNFLSLKYPQRDVKILYNEMRNYSNGQFSFLKSVFFSQSFLSPRAILEIYIKKIQIKEEKYILTIEFKLFNKH